MIYLKTIKHFWKVFRYTVSFDKKKLGSLFLDLFLLIISILTTILPDNVLMNPIGVLKIILIVLICINIIRNIQGFYKFIDADYIGGKSSENKFISKILDDVKKPLKYEGFKFSTEKSDYGTAFYSKQLNKFLMKKNYIPAVLDQKGYEKVRRYIESNYAKILPYFSYYVRKCTNENRIFENRKVLCMSSDIHRNRPVRCI